MRSPSRKVAVEGKSVNSSPGVGAKRSRHIKADEKRETGLTKYNLQKRHIGLKSSSHSLRCKYMTTPKPEHTTEG